MSANWISLVAPFMRQDNLPSVIMEYGIRKKDSGQDKAYHGAFVFGKQDDRVERKRQNGYPNDKTSSLDNLLLSAQAGVHPHRCDCEHYQGRSNEPG